MLFQKKKKRTQLVDLFLMWLMSYLDIRRALQQTVEVSFILWHTRMYIVVTYHISCSFILTVQFFKMLVNVFSESE